MQEMKKSFFNAMLIMVVVSCASKHDYRTIMSNADTYAKTVYELNSVVMGNNFSPVVASRNYLYANVAAYEVIAAGYPSKYASLAGQSHGLSFVPRPDSNKKINFEFASLLAFWRLGKLVTFSTDHTNQYIY